MSAFGATFERAVNIMCHCRDRNQVIWVRSCSRWAIVPMKIYEGPGVTVRDLLEDTNEYLESIAHSLRRCCPDRR